MSIFQVSNEKRQPRFWKVAARQIGGHHIPRLRYRWIPKRERKALVCQKPRVGLKASCRGWGFLPGGSKSWVFSGLLLTFSDGLTFGYPLQAGGAPRAPTGLFNSLSVERQRAVLHFNGPQDHGDPAFRRKAAR